MKVMLKRNLDQHSNRDAIAGAKPIFVRFCRAIGLLGFVICSLSLVNACGQKGPLTLPQPQQPASKSEQNINPEASQQSQSGGGQSESTP